MKDKDNKFGLIVLISAFLVSIISISADLGAPWVRKVINLLKWFWDTLGKSILSTVIAGYLLYSSYLWLDDYRYHEGGNWKKHKSGVWYTGGFGRDPHLINDLPERFRIISKVTEGKKLSNEEKFEMHRPKRYKYGITVDIPISIPSAQIRVLGKSLQIGWLEIPDALPHAFTGLNGESLTIYELPKGPIGYIRYNIDAIVRSNTVEWQKWYKENNIIPKEEW